MKNVKYLSPTSIGVWENNQEEFYLKYLADDRPDKIPQTLPMAVGSAFDAYTKSYLHEKLFGPTPEYEFETLFEKQVEPQNRDKIREAGKYCFEAYKISGALADIMLLLNKSAATPRFEFTVEGGDIEGVTFLGKPDAHFSTAGGDNVVLDWKVNGFFSKSSVSPTPGYTKIRDGWLSGRAANSRNANGKHSDAHIMKHKDVYINVNCTLDKAQRDWARQVCIYAWLCGEPIGSEFVVAIDQLCCKPSDTTMQPLIRVAEHRSLISAEFQKEVYETAKEIWEIVHSDWIFRNMSPEESKARCEVLDRQASTLRGEGTVNDEWFNQNTRGL